MAALLRAPRRLAARSARRAAGSADHDRPPPSADRDRHQLDDRESGRAMGDAARGRAGGPPQDRRDDRRPSPPAGGDAMGRHDARHLSLDRAAGGAGPRADRSGAAGRPADDRRRRALVLRCTCGPAAASSPTSTPPAATMSSPPTGRTCSRWCACCWTRRDALSPPGTGMGPCECGGGGPESAAHRPAHGSLAVPGRTQSANRHRPVSRTFHGMPCAVEEQPLHLGPGEGPRAEPAEDRDLVAGLVDRAVAVEALGQGQRRRAASSPRRSARAWARGEKP